MSHADNSPSGGYACGRRTRERIIAAALQVFGEEGYDRGSTRRIAQRAGVSTPAIRYYFGSKQGLRAACARHITARVTSLLEAPLIHADHVLGAPEPAAALGALCELLAALVDGLAVAGSENWSLTSEHVCTGLFDTIERLVAAATPDSSGERRSRLRACMLLGYVNSLYENRVRTLDVMGWSHWGEEALALMKSVIREQACGAPATDCASSTPA
jgi:TetR/AcrR family transcriptional regulator, regulator of cefoperazone and chloramphenicol sensitivity